MARLSLFALSILLLVGLAPTVANAHSNGSRPLTRAAARSEFKGGKTLYFPDHLAITLVDYKPVTNLTQYPGGPPLRPVPVKECRFVATRWLVRNESTRPVRVGLWVTNPDCNLAMGFVTGNVGNIGIVEPGATVSEYFLFEVLRKGPVDLYYAPSTAWTPRGK